MELIDDNYCFACGKENPIGLKLEFEYDEDEVKVEFQPKKEHQGWDNVIHGGILFTLMDEAMARLIIEKGDMVVTSRMETKFLRPARVGENIVITGRIEKKDKKKIQASSRIKNTRGKLLATSRGIYVRVNSSGK